jgi:RHS repeat-associated protein
MIEEAESEAYYYHYDALGSVVALSDSSGDTVQTYEYTVFGEVWASDIDHPNPYMFAGRRYDIEIGLYYSRARYYNPYMGRFLQTDPIGYGGGINLYAYCGNNSLNHVDPSGLILRDREPNDVLTAVICTELGQWYGLVGDWDLEQVYAWYNAEPQEIAMYTIDGMTVYVETSDGAEHPIPPGKDESLVVVRLTATDEAYYSNAIADAEPITKEAVTEEAVAEESIAEQTNKPKRGRWKAVVAVGCVCATDGPLPIADAICAGTFTYIGVREAITVWKAHRKNRRTSTSDKHYRGTRRERIDRGREKGDSRRRPPRKRPKGWKGPWPPPIPPIEPILYYGLPANL